MYCKFCNKLWKNNRSKSQHEIRCKLNPNKILLNEKSFDNIRLFNSRPRNILPDIEGNCKFCDKVCKNKNSLTQHEVRCKLNPSRIIVKSNLIDYNKKVSDGEIIKSNQYTKALILGLPKPIISEETRLKIGKSSKGRIWTQEMREKHSQSMIQATINYPESYSSNNVCGRTKLIEVIDSFGNITKVNGGWEKLVVDYLNDNKIKWTNRITEQFYYFWNEKNRIYYPDFYLVDYDKYIEVKGYQRERDIHKWEILKDRLIIIKKDDISLIKSNMFKLNL